MNGRQRALFASTPQVSKQLPAWIAARLRTTNALVGELAP
jgi:hypothetical protein